MNQNENFEQFMRNYQNMVFTTAVRLVANEAEAQDISQEVFLKAFERFAELHTSPTVGGLVANGDDEPLAESPNTLSKTLDVFSELFASDSEEDQPMFDLPAPEVTGDFMNEADQRKILEEALTKLPPGQRVPLVLYHFENKSYEEIAASLKISLSKVKTDIFRGREALKKKLMLRGAAEEMREDFVVRKPVPPRHNPFRTLAHSYCLF